MNEFIYTIYQCSLSVLLIRYTYTIKNTPIVQENQLCLHV